MKLSVSSALAAIGTAAKAKLANPGASGDPTVVRKLWTAGEDQLLGTMHDQVLAQRLGVPVYIVSHRRRRLGIKPAPKGHPHAWSVRELALLGTKPDAEVARLIHRSVLAVRCQRSLRHIPAVPDPNAKLKPYAKQEEALLGTLPDAEVARKLGRTMFAVQARRIALRIPKFNAQRRAWTPAEDALLGRSVERPPHRTWFPTARHPRG
jgi:hypothetical protein